MTDRELEQIQNAAEKLLRIESVLKTDPSVPALRHEISVHLRYLLFNGKYQKAWWLIEPKKAIVLPAVDLKMALDKREPLDKVKTAQALGLQIGNTYLAAFVLASDGRGSGMFLQNLPSWPRPPSAAADVIKNFKLEQFLESPCIAWHGKVWKRREVIDFAAHYEGGVHFKVEQGEEPKNDALNSLKQASIVNVGGHAYTVAHAEILAIAQNLVDSAHCKQFLIEVGKRGPLERVPPPSQMPPPRA